MSGSGVDWGAIAKLAGALGKSTTLSGYANIPTQKANPTAPTAGHPYGPAFPEVTETGTLPGADGTSAGLLGPLSLPKGVNPGDTFTWQIDNDTPGRHTLTQMTLAGSLSWLRNLAATNQQQYNEVIAALVRAGYVQPKDARYGSYTSAMGTKFLQSAIDTEQANNDGGNGGVVKSWWNHIDDLYQSRLDSGQINADGSTGSGSGSGSGGRQPLTRQDTYTNPEDVKAAINSAAKSILGRHLTDTEVAQFAAAYHGQEQTFNDQNFAQQKANYDGLSNAPAAVDHPNLSAAAENYADNSPALGQERTTQLLGSYIGVLRNMTGLGAGGVSSAVA